MERIESQVDRSADEFQQNASEMLLLVERLHDSLRMATEEGPQEQIAKHKARGKLLARERIQLLLDPDSPFLELLPLAGWEQKGMTLGGSLVAGIGLVEGVECLIHANVPTVKGGALNQISVQKSARLNEIARENKLPVIYLNESAGADLPQQSLVFNYGGAIFRDITQRSKEGIPSVTLVFGNSTAGGAYVPGMSDYVVMVDRHARTYLAGPPLVKMATNEDVDDETLGGASMHAHTSGLCDYLAHDEKDALRIARAIVGQFRKVPGIYGQLKPSPQVEAPLYDPSDLLGIVPVDVRKPYDIRELIARLVDGSRFFAFKPLYGETLVTGWGKIHGFPVGILANNGVLFSEAANKGTQFIQLCCKQNVPLVYLQNITGFMVGSQAEREGIIKNGAKLINAVSNSELPALTFIVGSSYGAGNYGMCGRAYNPRFLFTWPNSKLAVMGPDQLVGVLSLLAKQKEGEKGRSETKLLDLDQLKNRIEAESDAFFGTSRLWDDAIIDPRETRNVAGFCLAIIERHRPQTNEARFGVFRM
ncbi:MAG: acyl-CoA carboxylase subunit beta [Deltaproteobacteria bacterium]|nr:acyl-CoA carboxylase subunit beta [Deltaproteobacteria bacterium]